MDRFDVILLPEGPPKIELIRIIRDITGSSLEEARELIERLPSAILRGVSRELAEAIKARLDATGARARIQPAQPLAAAARIDTEPPGVRVEVEGIPGMTVGDQLRIRAFAEDNIGVTKLEVYLDGYLVRTCQTWMCPYSETMTQPGPHRCWAVAEDAAGNRTQSKTREFMVHPTDRPGPALTTRIQPYEPTRQDRIRFIVDASHPSGVASITILINDSPVKTCSGSHCEYKGGPYPPGELFWRASARSNDGGETYGQDHTIEIRKRDFELR